MIEVSLPHYYEKTIAPVDSAVAEKIAKGIRFKETSDPFYLPPVVVELGNLDINPTSTPETGGNGENRCDKQNPSVWCAIVVDTNTGGQVFRAVTSSTNVSQLIDLLAKDPSGNYRVSQDELDKALSILSGNRASICLTGTGLCADMNVMVPLQGSFQTGRVYITDGIQPSPADLALALDLSTPKGEKVVVNRQMSKKEINSYFVAGGLICLVTVIGGIVFLAWETKVLTEKNAGR